MSSVAPESTGQQDVRTYLKILWRWKLLFLAFVVLIPLGAYLLERGKPKIYQSSTLLDASGSSLGVGSSNLPSTSNPQAVARLVTTDAVGKRVARRLHAPPASAGSLLDEVSATADTNTGFLTITVQDHDPARAAAIANNFAAALGGTQAARANLTINKQLRVLGRQLALTRTSDQVARGALSQQIAQLKELGRSIATGLPVIDPAVASRTPVGPKTLRAVELAFVITLLLGIGAVLIAENSDRRLRTPEDLEGLTEMPLLGTIPRGAFSPDQYLTRPNIEAFQMLQAALTYYNIDRPLASVVVVSPGQEEGKTTVAIGLAIATARAGGRAILVDADLRRPQVSSRLGMPPADGLGSVLAHERELSDVLVEHLVDAPEGGQLLVLPAGPPPLNPSALINSERMRVLLRELERRTDLVIIDTAATLAVSDSLPLIQTASGIAMIVRLNRSSRAAVRRLQDVIASTRGTVMGVVATGAGSMTYGYRDGYYLAQNRRGGAPRGPLGRLRQRTAARRAVAPATTRVESEQRAHEPPLPVASAAASRRSRIAAPLSPTPDPEPAPAPAVTRARSPLRTGDAWKQRLSDAARQTRADRAGKRGG